MLIDQPSFPHQPEPPMEPRGRDTASRERFQRVDPGEQSVDPRNASHDGAARRVHLGDGGGHRGR